MSSQQSTGRVSNALPTVRTLQQHLLKALHIPTSDEGKGVPNLRCKQDDGHMRHMQSVSPFHSGLSNCANLCNSPRYMRLDFIGLSQLVCSFSGYLAFVQFPPVFRVTLVLLQNRSCDQGLGVRHTHYCPAIQTAHLVAKRFPVLHLASSRSTSHSMNVGLDMRRCRVIHHCCDLGDVDPTRHHIRTLGPLMLALAAS